MRVLVCQCANTDLVDDHAWLDVVKALPDEACTVVPDLCDLAARQPDALAQQVHQGLTAVVACHARTVRWLCHRAGATLPQDTACLNLRTQPAADVIAALGLQPAAETGAPPDPPSARDWPPWYPVIDYDRCTNCKQCLQFCLFGTYETDADDRVTVAQPQNCKNNCPACARICPATAIIFPKLDEEPLNGAEVVDEQAQRDRAHSSMQQILGSDPYQALRARQQRAGRLVDRQKLERARQERERCRREHGDDEG